MAASERSGTRSSAEPGHKRAGEPIMFNQSDLYHIGIVVEDFEGEMDRMSRDMGLTWSPLIQVPVPVWTRDYGMLQLQSCAVYSQQQPCIELVKAVPNSPWVPLEGRPLHHLGYWTDDLDAASSALEANGCAKILCAYADGRMFGMAYHEMRNGMYVELVDRNSFADWPAFLAGKMQHEVQHP